MSEQRITNPMPNPFPESLPPIVEHMPAVALRLSHEGDSWHTWFVTKNISMYGYCAEDFYTERLRWLDIVHPDDRVLLMKTVNDYELHGVNSFKLYYRLLTANGESIPVTEYNTVNRGKDGEILCYDVAIVSDNQNETSRLIDDHLRQQAVLNDILMSLHDSDQGHAIQIILDRTGAYLDTSRVLLFKDSPDHKTCKIVYEWCNKDITSVMALDYSITYETSMPEIYVALQATGNLIVNFGEIPESCREEFEAEGLVASAIFAVYLNGEHYGFICFDDCVIERQWDENAVRFLKSIANIISTVIARQDTTRKLEMSHKTYEAVLNNVDSYIFVLNPADERIIFANRSFKEDFGFDCEGKPFLKCFTSSDTAMELPPPSLPESGVAEIYNEKTGRWLTITSEEILWVDGQEVSLINCYDSTSKKLYADMVERLAFLDHLTGLPNRYRCDTELEEALSEAKKTGESGYLLFIDMDDFKIVNDSFGHDYGDAVLITLAEYLKGLIEPPHGVYRFGGDEFLIRISHKAPIDIQALLNTILARGAQPWRAKDKEFYCTLSIGVVEYPGEEEDPRSIIKHADIAMYESKRLGKNKYRFYEQQLDTSSVRRTQTETLLRKAMENDFKGFIVHYQPIVDGTHGKILGAEALLRMTHDGKILSPGEFLPLANYLGFIVPIGKFVLRAAAQECRKIREAGLSDFLMTVNLSARQLGHKTIAEDIFALLDEVGLPYENFAVSVDEEDLIAGPERIAAVINTLREGGVKIVLDNFGAGKSSLLRLRDLPVDIIKTATDFVQRLESEFSKEFIHLVIRLSHSIGRTICINGIETAEQFDFCKKSGADQLQGFYLHTAEEAAVLKTIL